MPVAGDYARYRHFWALPPGALALVAACAGRVWDEDHDLRQDICQRRTDDDPRQT